MQVKFTSELFDKIIALTHEGKSLQDIAKQLKFSVSGFFFWLSNGKGMSDETIIVRVS